MEESVKKFNKIGEAIASEFSHIEKIYLDNFISDGEEESYIVVEFVGGGKCVRNALFNSLSANIKELSMLLNGGYYEEIREYNELKEKAKHE